MSEAKDQSATVRQQIADDLKFRLWSGHDLDAIPDPDYLIDGVIEEKAFTALYGPPASFKTFVAVHMALSIAAGRAWYGRAVRQRPVVYGVGEGSLGIKKRRNAWRVHYPDADISGAFFVLAPVQLMSDGNVKSLLRQIDQMKIMPGLIVFDTLATSMVGGDENSAQDMGKVVHAVRHIQERTGSAVLLVHHSGKTRDGIAASERGSSALRGGTDTMIKVEKTGKADLSVKITMDKNKDDEAAGPIVVSLTKVLLGVNKAGKVMSSLVLDSVRPVNENKAARMSSDVLTALTDFYTFGRGGNVKVADWQKVFGMSESTLSRRRRDLLDGGFIASVEGQSGVYALTTTGLSAVTEQSRPSIDTPPGQPASPPLGVTMTVDMDDDYRDFDVVDEYEDTGTAPERNEGDDLEEPGWIDLDADDDDER